MMLGSKASAPMMPSDFSSFRAPKIRKTFEIRSFFYKNGYFLMFSGSQSHDFSCKHENHDLLTLASCYKSIGREPFMSKRKASQNNTFDKNIRSVLL